MPQPPRPVLSRPETGPRVHALTGIRFIAALAVVFQHGAVAMLPDGYVQRIAREGRLGVDLFFLLSGFVLAWSARPGQSPGRFWWNRFARIWPLHGITLVFWAVAISFVGWELFAINGLLLQSWLPGTDAWFAYNYPSWSLSCEAFFYLMFPLLFVRLRGASSRTLWGAVAGAVSLTLAVPLIIRVVPALWPLGRDITTQFPPYRIAEFIIGIALAELVLSGWRPRVRPWMASVAVAAIVLGLASNGGEGLSPWIGQVLVLGPFAAIIAGLAAREVDGHRSAVASPRMVTLGEASFAMYLCHAPLLALAVGEGRPMAWLPGVAAVAAFAVASVVVSLAAHAGFERPAERWLRARGPRDQVPAT